MRRLRKWRPAGHVCRRVVKFCLFSLMLGMSSDLQAGGTVHRFEVLSTQIEVDLPAQAKVVQCRPDGRGFVVSLTGVTVQQLRAAFREWEPDPLLSEFRVEGDSSGAEPTVVLTRGAVAPRAAVRAQVKRGKLSIRAHLEAPATSEYYTEAGVYLARRNRPHEALAQFRKAIALQPDNARAYLEAAKIRAALGQKSLAIFNAKKAAHDARLRAQANALLSKLDPHRWGRMRRSTNRASRPLAHEAGNGHRVPAQTGEKAHADRVRLQSVDRPDSVAARTTLQSAKIASAKPKLADNRLQNGAGLQTPALAEPTQDVLSTHSAKEADAVEPFSIPGNAWAFLFALGMAVLFTAPLTWLFVRTTKAHRGFSGSPFVRVPANTPPLDDFQRLLAERTETGAVGDVDKREEDGQAPEGEVESVLRTIQEKQRPLIDTRESGAPEEGLFDGTDWARLQRDVRVELESVVALADRGLTTDEIARRIGLGREEVRLVLAMNRTKLGHLDRPRAGERGLLLTFAE